MLDGGNRKWLLKLQERERNFHDWLGRARETAHTPEERDILGRLREVYQQYDTKRDEVVNLFDQGNVAAAEKLLVNDVGVLYDQAYELCESFIKANERYVDATVGDARRQIRWVSLAVGGCVLLTIGLGAVLLWLFFGGIVFPLRAMISDARGFAGETPTEGRPLPTDELRAVGVYLRNLMTDVADTRTTLERSRGQLKDAEKLASVGKLAASVAHEIRNPLTAIKMWLFSIQKQVGADEELTRKFEIVSEEIRRLENIVRNFLEFSRPPEVKLAVESISSLLDNTLELTEFRIAERKIRLVREDAKNSPTILGDREQLKQVLLNLLDNAAEATGEGGEVSVSTTAEPDAGRAPDGGRAGLRSRTGDTARGLPADLRAVLQHEGRRDGTGPVHCSTNHGAT